MSAVAVLTVIGAAIFLWPGGSHRPGDKAFAQQLAGDWVGVDDPKERVTFDGDQIIVNGDQMATCKLDDSARTVTFTLGDHSDRRPCSAHLGVDGRLYCKRVDTGKGSILAREYVGGWRTPGQVDHGHRMAGLENLDRPQPTRTRIVTPTDHGVAAAPAAAPATPADSDVRGRSTVNADGSMDGSMTGDGYSARSHLNRDGSGEGDYSAGGRTVHVTRKADGTSTVESR